MYCNTMGKLSGDIDICDVFERHRAYMSDVSTVDYTVGSTPTKGFGECTSVFNDGIIFKILSSKSQHKHDIIWGRTVLSEVFGNKVLVMPAGNGKGKSILLRLSHDGIPPQECISKMRIVLSRYKRIRLSSADFTMDCPNITTRKDVENWLPGGTVIAEHAARVGNNCISWYDVAIDGGKIRIKVYNKIVQLFESAGVFEKNGSNFHMLLNDSALSGTALKFKECGVSRIEITFYSETVSDFQYYVDALHDVHKRLQTCPSYVASIKKQWQQLATCITQTIAVYHAPSKTFGYCHWWNSMTGKMQGASRNRIDSSDVLKLLGNFSFYDRPMYLIRAKSDQDEAVEVYMRREGGHLMTMIPGERGGFYPSEPKHQLSDYGIGAVPPGYIGWKEKFGHNSKPLAQVDQIQSSSVLEELVTKMSALAVNPREYDADYDLLDVGSQYTIISYGESHYHGKSYMFARTSDGKYIRCGAYLKSMLEEHRESGNTAVLTIVVLRKVKPGNKKNVICDIVKA